MTVCRTTVPFLSCGGASHLSARYSGGCLRRVVRQCVTKGLVSGRLAATDSTHVKANASRASEYLVEMPAEPGIYWERLGRL